jgi:hypothetical protein
MLLPALTLPPLLLPLLLLLPSPPLLLLPHLHEVSMDDLQLLLVRGALHTS